MDKIPQERKITELEKKKGKSIGARNWLPMKIYRGSSISDPKNIKKVEKFYE